MDFAVTLHTTQLTARHAKKSTTKAIAYTRVVLHARVEARTTSALITFSRIIQRCLCD